MKGAVPDSAARRSMRAKYLPYSNLLHLLSNDVAPVLGFRLFGARPLSIALVGVIPGEHLVSIYLCGDVITAANRLNLCEYPLFLEVRGLRWESAQIEILGMALEHGGIAVGALPGASSAPIRGSVPAPESQRSIADICRAPTRRSGC